MNDKILQKGYLVYSDFCKAFLKECFDACIWSQLLGKTLKQCFPIWVPGVILKDFKEAEFSVFALLMICDAL